MKTEFGIILVMLCAFCIAVMLVAQRRYSAGFDYGFKAGLEQRVAIPSGSHASVYENRWHEESSIDGFRKGYSLGLDHGANNITNGLYLYNCSGMEFGQGVSDRAATQRIVIYYNRQIRP